MRFNLKIKGLKVQYLALEQLVGLTYSVVVSPIAVSSSFKNGLVTEGKLLLPKAWSFPCLEKKG